MLLIEVAFGRSLIKPSSTDKGAFEMNFPIQMDPKWRDIGARTKVRKEKVTVHSTGKDRQVYGRRTIFQKSTGG